MRVMSETKENKNNASSASAQAKFAVIETGGKQYKVAVGDVVTIGKLAGDHTAGEMVTFDKVLLVDDGNNTNIGVPYVLGAKVEAEFKETKKGKKLSIIRYQPKSRHTRRVGYRDTSTKVKITKIA